MPASMSPVTPLGADEVVAKSRAMRRVLDVAARVAGSDVTVLITGESGTGKERVAHVVHEHSLRASRPFLAVNCGALPESLLESELFGHVRGAFTGAVSDKKGLFEAAAGGTLFLDEIGETSAAVQVKLLRALQEHSVRPVGATKDVHVDTRIIAATNRELEVMVQERAFRKDLYYRLHVVSVEVPPLRARREDILPLARQFIQRACAEYCRGPCSLAPDVPDLLLSYDWPGNVRELQSAMERAVLLAEDKPTIERRDLPPEIRAQDRVPAPVPGEVLTLAELERRHILATLERLGGNKLATARALGIGLNTLRRRLRGYGASPASVPLSTAPVRSD